MKSVQLIDGNKNWELVLRLERVDDLQKQSNCTLLGIINKRLSFECRSCQSV
jgi:hypothetical protein